MSHDPLTSGAGTDLALRGNLLPAAIRRDIADLNRLFLQYALEPVHQSDAWFLLPPRAVAQLTSAPAEALDRVAQGPFTLFELSLPSPDDRLAWHPAAVADAEPADRAAGRRVDAHRAFGLIALGVARRLAEGVPMSPRIAFGVGAEAESRLSGLSPSEAFGVASWPGLVRPRWPRHERYWCMLAAAACGGDPHTLRWAFYTGMCLRVQVERAIPCVDAQTARRKLRAVPVR
jgi:hypothetical protein